MRCKAWRGTSEFLSKYFHKGSEILIQGKMVTEEWEKDGEKKSRTICVVENVNFCGKSDGAKPNSQVTGNDGFMNIPQGIDEELPFS
jgi:single-strand DNA-binding protein